jgi:7-carboxy-7-deazaguanine synthase
MCGRLKGTAPLTLKKFSVAEIFSSIQGESTFTGIPCTFVRLTGCNLRCSYCDTQFAYSGGTEMNLDEIIEKVLSLDTPIVEITGGEPLMHSFVDILTQELLNAGKRVLIETNGSYRVDVLPKDVVKIVDIKTPSSGEADSFLLENLTLLDSKDEIKFVIGTREDYDWAMAILNRYNLNQTVIFSPSWGVIEPEMLTKWIVEDRAPVRLGLQIHKVIWDADRQGV